MAKVDFDWNYPPAHIRSIAKGVPITVLSGLHIGCLELIANDRVQSIPDLKGKRAGVDDLNGNTYLLLMMIAADEVNPNRALHGNRPSVRSSRRSRRCPWSVRLWRYFAVWVRRVAPIINERNAMIAEAIRRLRVAFYARRIAAALV